MADGIAAASRSVSAAKAAVALTDVVVSFRVAVGTYTAIDRATLNVGDGEFVAIVGPTGCDIEQRRLPATCRADDRDELTIADLQRCAIDRRVGADGDAERNHHIGQRDGRLGSANAP